mmetsp:Transcript_13144/g.13731  ORF Transcript_13144/g.13731 Transcript_13144/m.13731 type:complete len:247 (-) Transcript_13144:624-1364(-)
MSLSLLATASLIIWVNIPPKGLTLPPVEGLASFSLLFSFFFSFLFSLLLLFDPELELDSEADLAFFLFTGKSRRLFKLSFLKPMLVVLVLTLESFFRRLPLELELLLFPLELVFLWEFSLLILLVLLLEPPMLFFLTNKFRFIPLPTWNEDLRPNLLAFEGGARESWKVFLILSFLKAFFGLFNRKFSLTKSSFIVTSLSMISAVTTLFRRFDLLTCSTLEKISRLLPPSTSSTCLSFISTSWHWI